MSSYEKEKIFCCDLVYKLTLGHENFLYTNNFDEVNQSFFKKLSKIKWSNNAKNLNKTLYGGLWHVIGLYYDTNAAIIGSFGFCIDYLSCCRALTHGRLEVSSEDVVQSWLLALNLFLMDLRPYIKDFNSASAIFDAKNESKQINISESQSNKKSSSIIRKVLVGVLSIIIVFLLLFAMSAILILIFGDAVDNYVDSLRPIGIVGLALASALGKKIYDKLV